MRLCFVRSSRFYHIEESKKKKIYMDKGKAVMGSGRRWAVGFTDNSASPSSRDIPDPPGFTRASQDQVSLTWFYRRRTIHCLRARTYPEVCVRLCSIYCT